MSLTANIEIVYQPATITDINGSFINNAQVYIAIYDAITAQPANGNNCLVIYTVTDENNNTSTNTINIPGMRSLIYTGEVGRTTFNSKKNVLSSSNKTFKVLSVGPGDDSVSLPPVPGNLTVQIKVDSPESAPNAADGQITITATSNYLPIAYQLDGLITAASPTFSGLSGGNHTVTVIDAADYSLSQTIYVPTVTSTLVSDPSVTLQGNHISRWNAAFNPIIFTYQRKDFSVTGMALNTLDGKTRVSVNTDVSAVLKDDYVYLQTETLTGSFKVLSVYDNFTLVIDEPFSQTGQGFININRLRPYYKMLTRISFFDKITGKFSAVTATHRPNNTGLTRADISNFLQSLLRASDDYTYNEPSHRDDNLSASYQIAYAQHWDNGTDTGYTSDFVTIDKPYYVVYAAKQLGETYGGNMAAYVPFATTPAGTAKAAWITDFAEPACSVGYPFDMSFIYSEDLVGRQIYAEFTPLDINRNPLPGSSASYLLNDDGSWLLNSDGSKMVIARQSISKADVPGQLGLNRLLINGPFPDDAYYLDIVLKYDEGDTTHTVTQTQTIRIDDAVDDQSVYLRWIGLSGSWNYYRFVYNQEVSLDVQNAVIIKKYVTDWQNQQGIDEVISKAAGQKVKVLAEDLSVADIKGLQSIKYSPKVQLLVNRNPVKWQTVVVNTATYSEYDTRNQQAPFSITFSLPAINVQAQ